MLFDLDGTLTDYRRYVQETLAELAATVAERGVAPAATFLAAYAAVQAEDEQAQLDGRLTVVELRNRERRFSRALARCGPHPSELATELGALYASARCRRSFPMPGAEATLQFLRDRGVELAIVTEGSSEEQRGQLAVLGWADYFAAVVISGEVGVHKPDPALVRLALGQLGVPPARAAFVGDRAIWDLRPANELGLRTFLLENEAYRDEAEQGRAHIDARAASHAALVPLLGDWLEER